VSADPTILPFKPMPALAEGSVRVPLSELATANRQRDALYRLSEDLHRAGSAHDIYSAALEAIEAALGCDRSSILLFDADGVMQFVAWRGLSDGYRAAVSGHSPWGSSDVEATPIAITDIANAELDPALKERILGEGIRATAFIPLVGDGALIGKFMAYFRTPRDFSPEDLTVAMAIARHLGFAIQRQRTQQKLQENEATLAEELEATRSLQQLSVEIAHEIDLGGLYEKLIEAAQRITRSDFASMQEYHENRGPAGELQLLAFRNFDPGAAKFWRWVRANSQCTCGVAYRTLERVIVRDVEEADFLAGTEDLKTYRAAGIRAVQSTPLLSRDGSLVGMISTHWREPHTPTERDLRLLDILARLAADLIERKHRDEELRRREERSRTLTQLLSDVPWQARADGAFESLQPAWENYTGQTWDAHAGHGWFEAIHPDDRDAVRISWATACFETRPYEYCARLWHAHSKQYRMCRIRATPIRNQDGSLREWVGACMDVDVQRSAKSTASLAD
jgi:PAS domain S-box-containing protein